MLNNKIKNLRIKTGLTQSELAIEVGLPQSCISLWEKGKREPNLNGLKKLAEYFQVSTDYLLGLTATSNESREGVAKTDNSLSDEEKEIVDMYRKLPPDLKRVIFATEKQFAKEQEENNQLFSAHKKY